MDSGGRTMKGMAKQFLIVDPCGNTVLLSVDMIKNENELKHLLMNPEIVKKINRHDTMGELTNYLKQYIRGELED